MHSFLVKRMNRIVGNGICIALLVLFFFLSGCLGPKPVELGNQAYEAGDYTTAAQQYQLGDDEGDLDAKFSLALLYAEGQGVAQNSAKAIALLDECVSGGHALAATTLGIYAYYGIHMSQDYEYAAANFALGSLKGEPLAIDYLMYMLDNGVGVEKNTELAAMLPAFMEVY